MDDLERATQLLGQQGNTCALCKADQVYTSRERGVRPMLELLRAGADLRGFSAADKVMGKAAAFLFVLAGVTDLQTQVISEPALALLCEHGVHVRYGACVPRIMNRRGDGPCPMESAVSQVWDPDRALAVITEKCRQMQAGAPATAQRE